MTLTPLQEEQLMDRFEELKQELDSAVGNEIEFKKLLSQMVSIAAKLPHLKDWLSDKRTFWDNAASDWFLRIDKDVREFVSTKLKEQILDDLVVLELASGSWQAVPGSICVDISRNMLLELKEEKRVISNLEHPLPFKSDYIDVVVMVFIANYIENLSGLLSEVSRILKKTGKLVIIQSLVSVNSYHKVMEKYDGAEFEKILTNLLKDNNFNTLNIKEKIGTHKLNLFITEK